MIFVFSSFIHGSGRSTLKEKFRSFLEKKFKVLSLSSGEIFRRLAAKEGKSIEEFIKEITEDLNKALNIDLKIDKLMYLEIMKNRKKYDFILIDSSIAPYYLKAFNIYVKADLEIIAERILRKKRFGDKEYKNIDEVKREIINRSKNDLKRYKRLAETVSGFWKKVYSSYGKNVFYMIVYNNEDIERVFRRFIRKLSLHLIKYLVKNPKNLIEFKRILKLWIYCIFYH